jgi:hypothetical protein
LIYKIARLQRNNMKLVMIHGNRPKNTRKSCYRYENKDTNHDNLTLQKNIQMLI